MSNTHIERGEGGREEKRRRRRMRGRGLGSGRELPRLLGRVRLVQRTMRGTGMGTGQWNAWAVGLKRHLLVSCYSGVQFGCLSRMKDWIVGISLENDGWLDEEEDEQERVLAPVPKRGTVRLQRIMALQYVRTTPLIKQVLAHCIGLSQFALVLLIFL